MAEYRVYPSDPTPPPPSTQYYKGFDYRFPVSDAVHTPPLPPPATYHYQRPSRWLRLYFSFLFGMVLALGVAAVVIYAVLLPQSPKYAVQDVNVYEFNLTTNNRGVYLSSDMLFTINARNPNKKIGIYYDEANTEVWYEGGQIGQGSIAPFYQGHKNTTLVLLHITGTDVALPQAVGTTLGTEISNKQNISFRVTTTTLVRLKVGKWKSWSKRIRIICDVLLTAPGSGETQILNKQCESRRL